MVLLTNCNMDLKARTVRPFIYFATSSLVQKITMRLILDNSCCFSGLSEEENVGLDPAADAAAAFKGQVLEEEVFVGQHQRI